MKGTRRTRRSPLWLLALVVVVVAAALAAVACGGDDDDSADTGGGEAAVNQDVSGSISTLGIWAGEEQKSFQAVIDSSTRST